MIEIVGLTALLFTLLLQVVEILLELEGGVTLRLAFVLVPLLATLDWWYLQNGAEKTEGSDPDWPLPPEQFYWPFRRMIYLRQVVLLGLLTGFFWPFVYLCPARSELSALSFAGWLSGAGAIIASARFSSVGLCYWQKSQQMVHVLPPAQRGFRYWLYRITQNREYLGGERSR